MFYSGVSGETIFWYVLSLLLIVSYIVIKFCKDAHLFSYYNIYLYLEWMTQYLITPFLFFPNGVSLIYGRCHSLSVSYYYMEKALRINCIGETFFVISLICHEYFKSRYRVRIKRKRKHQWESWNWQEGVWFLPDKLICMEYAFFVACAVIIDIVGVHGIPIIAGSDGVLASPLRVPYLICMNTIPVYTLYFGLYFVNTHKRFLLFIAGVVLLYTYGKRSTLIFWVLFPVLVYAFMGRVRLKKLRGRNVVLIIGAFVLAALGLSLILTRSGQSAGGIAILQEAITGNTFADIRDGGLILWAYEKTRQKWLLGKTYLAGLVTFIPSSILEYKKHYGWGAYTSYTLLGMVGHPGLRGGVCMESYMNFSYIGVVIIAWLRGRFVGRFEKKCHRMIAGREYMHHSNSFILLLNITLLNSIITSGTMQSVYVILVILGVNYFLCYLLKGKKESEA